MKTKTFNFPISLAMMAVSLLLIFGCAKQETDEFERILSSDSGIPLKSVTFSFIESESEQPVCSFGYCDMDGCCTTPAERVDVFKLEPNHVYKCMLKLSESSSDGISGEEILNRMNYRFSYQPGGNIDLSITCPNMNDCGAERFCSVWKTGLNGTGYVKFTVDYSSVSSLTSKSSENTESITVVKPKPVEVASAPSFSLEKKSTRIPSDGVKSFEIKLPVSIIDQN